MDDKILQIAYDLGYAAFKTKSKRNPFRCGSEAAKAWRTGRLDAENHARKND